ncbi:MAG TPA: hypothetical protein VFX89_12130 [Gammaproteobacteria bacterium]|nr:hypothetical protein [Gammaproteobacteria bacterium]
MQKLTLAALSSAALLLTLAGCDRANGPGNGSAQVAQSSRPTFEQVDTNRDGRITAAEALAVQGLDFNRMDADKNQSVTPEEFASAIALKPRG